MSAATEEPSPFWRSARVYALASLFGALLHVAHLAWTHLLTPEEYGRFGNLQVLFSFAIATLSLTPQPYVLAHLHTLTKDRLARNLGALFPLALAAGALAVLATALLPAGALEVLGEGTPRWAVAGVVAAAALASGRLMAQAVAEARGRPGPAAAWIEVVDGVRPLVAFTLFFSIGLGWEARWAGLVLAHGGAGLLAVVLLRRQGWLRAPGGEAELGPTLRFVVPTLLTTLAYVAYDGGDRLVLTHFHGLGASGRYDVAYRLALLGQTVNLVLRRSFTPLFYAAYAGRRLDEARSLLLATTRRTLLFTLPLAFGLPAVLAFLPVLGEGYEGALGILPVVALGIAFWGVQTLWQQVLLAAGRASLPLYVSAAGAVLNLGLNVLLVPRFAEMGAAAATLASFVAMALAAALLARPYLKPDDVKPDDGA